MDIVVNLTPASEPIPAYNNEELSFYGRPLRLIGQGAYGLVILTDKNYVVKILKKRKYHSICEFSNDILNEIVFSGSLNHPGLIKYLDVFLSIVNTSWFSRIRTDAVALPMIKYDGDLRALIDSKPNLSSQNFQSLAQQLISTVAYLSSRNMIHCDIKPENILYRVINNEYEIKLADYGISFRNECYTTHHAYSSYTLYYRPPEIIIDNLLESDVEAKEIYYNSKADVWATGALLYELYTGNLLFPARLQGNQDLNMLIKIFEKVPSSDYVYQAKINKIKNTFPIQQAKVTGQIILPGVEGDLYNVLQAMLVMNPQKRISIFDLQQDPYFIKNNQVNNVPCQYRPHLFNRINNFYPVLQNNDNLEDIVLKMLEIYSQPTFEIDANTLIMAVDIFYRVLLLENLIASFDLLLVCVYVSNIFLNIKNKKISFFLEFSTLTGDEFKIIADDILYIINFDLNASNYYDYIVSQTPEGSIRHFATQILILCLPIFKLFFKWEDQATTYDFNLISQYINLGRRISGYSNSGDDSNIIKTVEHYYNGDKLNLFRSIIPKEEWKLLHK